jgi:hypothetical protein
METGRRNKPVKGPLKRGDYNESRTHRFWGYQKSAKNGEYWIHVAYYDEMIADLSKRKREYYERKKAKKLEL